MGCEKDINAGEGKTSKRNGASEAHQAHHLQVPKDGLHSWIEAA
jgi:hypothetical protein